MRYTDVEKEVFRKAIRELTFTPFITLPVLYGSSTENKLGKDEYDKIKDNRDYVNERKRHTRLLTTLLKDVTDDELPISQLITMPKIYDDVLKKKCINLYNHVAKRLKFPLLSQTAPSAEVLQQIAIIDSSHPSYETIIEYYPQYCTDKREGVNFIEYILLLNISLTTQSRSLTMLQKLLKKPENSDQINMWIDRVRKSMRSPSAYMSCVDTFFSNFRYVTAKKYNDTVTILRDEYDELKLHNADLAYYLYNESNAIMPNIVEIHNKVIPTAWYLINCANEKNPYKAEELRQLETVDSITKEKAERFAVEIKSYIDKAIEEAEAILPMLFIKQ